MHDDDYFKKLIFNIVLIFPIPGNPSKRKKPSGNPPVEQNISGFPPSVSSIAGMSLAVNPQDTIKTTNPPMPSPLRQNNSTGNVSNQGNAGVM